MEKLFGRQRVIKQQGRRQNNLETINIFYYQRVISCLPQSYDNRCMI